jgi:flagellar protein FlbD
MIELTRLNGNRLAVNSDLIQFAESAPDTLLTMVTGEKLIVTESLTEVADRMIAYRARMLAEAAADSAKRAAGKEALDEKCAGMMRRRRRVEA